MAELIQEDRGHRIWKVGDSYVEVRAQLRMQYGDMSAKQLEEFPGLAVTFEKIMRANLAAWFSEHGEADPLREPKITWHDIPVEWVEVMTDEDGEPIPFFETWFLKRCCIEQAYFPPPPEESTNG